MRRILILLFSFAFLFVGAGCASTNPVLRPITLEYWRYDAPENALDPIIVKYNAVHPNVTIKVRNFTSDEYDQALLEAFAEDNGPDMFSIPNVLLSKWKNQIIPMPGETSVATPVPADNGGRDGVILKKTQSPSLRDINSLYVDVAAKDMLLTIPASGDTPEVTAVLGIPYSADTLALFANSDVLRDVGATEPPATWQEFSALAQRFTVSRGSVISFSGAALGTAANIPHSTELLSALMQQNGTTMTSANGFARFDQAETSTRTLPAIEALLFYRDFANPGAASYSWNNAMPNALDAFVTGKTAFYFGYPADARVIRERNPGLRFDIAPLPQINVSQPSTVAYYPIEVVSNKTAHQNEAWDFILFAANAENVGDYLAITGQPPALRSLLAAAIANPEVAPFASQVLIAKSWYRGSNYEVVEDVFDGLIENQFANTGELRTIFTQSVGRINSTIQ